MHTLDMTDQVVFPPKRFGTGLDRAYQILRLKVYVLVVSPQVCSKTETRGATILWTRVLLSVNGIEMFAAKIRP